VRESARHIVRSAVVVAVVAAAVVTVDGSRLAPIGSAQAATDTSEPEAQTASRTLLVLPFDMVDTSLQGEINGGPLASDTARLQRTEAIVRRSLDHLDAFELVSSEAVKGRIQQAQGTYRYLYNCNGCDVDIGRAAGADLVMTGWVQKVSNLILNINATVRRTDTGAEVGGGSVDMRNDTDDSWRSAALYLVEHALLDNYRSRAGDNPEEAPSPEPGPAPAEVPIHHYPG